MNGRTRRKFGQNGVVPINTTLPSVLLPDLEKIIVKFGFKGPSDYFQSRIRLDAGMTLANGQNSN